LTLAAPSGISRGGHEDELTEPFIGHAAEEPLVQPGRLVGSGQNGREFSVVAVVDELVELFPCPGGG